LLLFRVLCSEFGWRYMQQPPPQQQTEEPPVSAAILRVNVVANGTKFRVPIPDARFTIDQLQAET
jgi:hypothetical protein